MAAYLVLMQQVEDAEPAEGEPPNSTELRFSITSGGQMVVSSEFTPAT